MTLSTNSLFFSLHCCTHQTMLNLNHLGKWATVSSPVMLPIFSKDQFATARLPMKASKRVKQGALSSCCRARRRVREDEEDESYEYNEEIAMLEMYSQSAKGEALIVNVIVDEQQVEVLIFKGFSSSLSHGTASDPSRSVVPERAVIQSIDIIKGPFDPSNIEYVEKGLSWEAFKGRLSPNQAQP